MQTILEIALSNAVMVTVLALLAAVMSRGCRRPALAHGLWLLVLLKLVTPPLVPVSITWLSLATMPQELRNASPSPQTLRATLETQPADSGPALKGAEPPVPGETGESILLFALAEAAPGEVSSTPTHAHPANLAEVLNAWVQPWFTSIGAPIWLGISLLWFLWTAIHSFRFQRLLRYARRAPASLQDQARALAARMGLKDYPGIWLVPGAVSPMLWFVGRTPRLLFPAGLLDQLDREQRATLLVHELAHYRRRDHWVRFVEMLALGLYWWHPVVWWARHELHEAEEQCCDAWVVWTLSGADRAYATALLQTVAFISQSRCPLPAAASGIGQVPHLRRRLTMIMQGKTPRSLSWAGFLAIVGLGLLLLPVHAQTPRSETEQEIAKLKQELRALEQKLRSEQDVDTTKKASAEEIAKAKEQVEAFGRDAEAKRKVFEEAVQRHHKAMAHLAALEGKKSFTITSGQPHVIWLEDGKANKGGKEEHRSIILRVSPDEKYDTVRGKIIELEKAAKENPRALFFISPKENEKPGPKAEAQNPYQFKLSAPDTKAEKPAAKGKPGENIYRNEFKKAPDTKADENAFRYEIRNWVEKPQKPGMKAAPSKDDRTSELERKLERLQKEIEELKDALKRGRSQAPAEKDRDQSAPRR